MRDMSDKTPIHIRINTDDLLPEYNIAIYIYSYSSY